MRQLVSLHSLGIYIGLVTMIDILEVEWCTIKLSVLRANQKQKLFEVEFTQTIQ
jgi:hypothetical protein